MTGLLNAGRVPIPPALAGDVMGTDRQSKRSETPGSNESAGRAAPRPQDRAGAARLGPGLYLVSTPIGNAADITLRALDVLRRADAIAAEDTRETRKLMEIHGVTLSDRPMISYHDRNGPKARPRIEQWLKDGLAIAYCSDAGSPLIADPGYRLAELAIAGDYPVTTVPGASAVLAALPLSGLPSDRFLFAGFLPNKSSERKRALRALATVDATLVFYESPHRIAASVADLAEVLGPERSGAIARELTKRFEDVLRGTLADLAERLESGPALKGEIVLMAGPPSKAVLAVDPAEVETALDDALARLSVKDAAREVADRFGLSRREIYNRAIDRSR